LEHIFILTKYFTNVHFNVFMIPCKRQFLTIIFVFFKEKLKDCIFFKSGREPRVKKDGHIHTPYCPHGTKDSLEEYVEQAISLGFEEITFAEHAPLPKGFIDTTPTKDSAMDMDQLESYFDDLDRLKTKYNGRIKINAGLEVDYIEGYEEKIKNFLNDIGKRLDDAILSVHFLKFKSSYDCIDYSPEEFEKIAKRYGGIDEVYKKYYETLMLSITADLGPFKPKRIGHITLIRKFHRKFPASHEFKNEIEQVLDAIKKYHYEIDYNGAGTRKPLCREPYPPYWVVEKAMQLGIPLVYGSDAHQWKELGQGREKMKFL
jgi:histidinol-phosphatase (PHP family)